MTESQKPGPRLPPEHIRRLMDAAAHPEAQPGTPPSQPSPTAPAPVPAAPPPAPEPAPRSEAGALHQQAIAEIQVGDMAAARAHLEQSLALERDGGAPADLAATLVMLGQVRFSQDEQEAGLALAREGLGLLDPAAPETARVQEIVEQMEALIRMDAPGGSRDLLRRGIVALQAGDGELAGELLDRSLEAAAAAGDGAVAAGALHHLGLLLFSAGHLTQAEAAVRDSIELNRALEDEPGLAAGLALRGQIVFAQGDHREGLRLMRESLLTWNALGMTQEATAMKALIAEFKAEADTAPNPPAD